MLVTAHWRKRVAFIVIAVLEFITTFNVQVNIFPEVQHGFTVVLAYCSWTKIIFGRAKHNLESKSFRIWKWNPKSKEDFCFLFLGVARYSLLSLRKVHTSYVKMCVWGHMFILSVWLSMCILYIWNFNTAPNAQGWVHK